MHSCRISLARVRPLQQDRLACQSPYYGEGGLSNRPGAMFPGGAIVVRRKMKQRKNRRERQMAKYPASLPGAAAADVD
ncbi:MAG: hypothetical protein ABIL58_22790 [Pseudomonadota bacterium]